MQGVLHHSSRSYGTSQAGINLDVYGPQDVQVLLIASMHGDESMGTVLFSEALRELEPDALSAGVILVANPDGILNGTRANGRGVDLNRNYPTANWQPDPVMYRARPEAPQDIALSPGATPGSEPETQALMALVNQLRPRLIVSIHGYLACIDEPQAGAVAQAIAQRTDLPLVPDVGYATPGSFGTWCAEQKISILTYELPSAGMVELRERHLPVFKDLMTGAYDDLLEAS